VKLGIELRASCIKYMSIRWGDGLLGSIGKEADRGKYWESY
jgi:hypothetical protein